MEKFSPQEKIKFKIGDHVVSNKKSRWKDTIPVGTHGKVFRLLGPFAGDNQVQYIVKFIGYPPIKPLVCHEDELDLYSPD